MVLKIRLQDLSIVYCFPYLNHGSYFSSNGIDCCGNGLSVYEGESYQTREKVEVLMGEQSALLLYIAGSICVQ